MKERRFGKFYINQDMVESGEIFKVFQKMNFIPWRAEHLSFRKEFEYIGHSPLFEVTPKFTEIPLYKIIINKLEGKMVKVEAERQ